MEFEINKLIKSDFKLLKDLGWLLYYREDQNGGLSLNEVHNLLKIITVDELEKVCDEAYEGGVNRAVEGH